jgi:hypothetical protein
VAEEETPKAEKPAHRAALILEGGDKTETGFSDSGLPI